MVVTTEEMMEQAIRMFKEYGYSQVSVDMICRSFHVTKGSFYHHFKSKEELLVKWFNALMEQMEHIAPDSEENPYDELRDILMKWAGILEEIGHELLHESLMANFHQSSKSVLNLHERFQEKTAMIPGRSVELIRKAQEQGLIESRLSAEDLTRMYSYTVIGLCVNWHMENGGFSLEEEIGKIFSAIFGEGKAV